jgi:hypothetical protein
MKNWLWVTVKNFSKFQKMSRLTNSVKKEESSFKDKKPTIAELVITDEVMDYKIEMDSDLIASRTDKLGYSISLNAVERIISRYSNVNRTKLFKRILEKMSIKPTANNTRTKKDPASESVTSEANYTEDIEDLEEQVVDLTTTTTTTKRKKY